MNKFELSPAFYIGHENIDRDHKELVVILNAMIDACQNKDISVCKKLWAEFYKKMQKHFEYEEQIQTEFRFEKVSEHRARSTEILHNMKKLSENAVDIDDWCKCIEEVFHNLMPFILRNDLPFAEHLHAIKHARRDD